MSVWRGDVVGEGRRIAIVVARFHEHVTAKLLEGALGGLRAHGVADDAVDVAWVPGAFEIPLVARRMASTGAYDAVICLGAVVRGRRRTSSSCPPRRLAVWGRSPGRRASP